MPRWVEELRVTFHAASAIGLNVLSMSRHEKIQLRTQPDAVSRVGHGQRRPVPFHVVPFPAARPLQWPVAHAGEAVRIAVKPQDDAIIHSGQLHPWHCAGAATHGVVVVGRTPTIYDPHQVHVPSHHAGYRFLVEVYHILIRSRVHKSPTPSPRRAPPNPNYPDR